MSAQTRVDGTSIRDAIELDAEQRRVLTRNSVHIEGQGSRPMLFCALAQYFRVHDGCADGTTNHVNLIRQVCFFNEVEQLH